MIREGKADFTSVKHFRTGIWVVVVVVVFFGERRMNGANSWTSTKKGRLIEQRQDHYTASIILPVFFVRAWVSVSLVPRRSRLIRCPREVSVTSQLMVESRKDRAENAWGLGWVRPSSDVVLLPCRT